MSGATINLKYQKFGPSIKPLINIEIQYKKEIVDSPVLVDSEADVCMFDAELCDVLGIDMKAGEFKQFVGPVQDRSGKAALMDSYKHKVGIVIGGHTRTTEVYFTEELASHGYSIVGQVGFFDKFKSVKFDYNDGRIFIKP